jgi:hypothetical protein
LHNDLITRHTQPIIKSFCASLYLFVVCLMVIATCELIRLFVCFALERCASGQRAFLDFALDPTPPTPKFIGSNGAICLRKFCEKLMGLGPSKFCGEFLNAQLQTKSSHLKRIFNLSFLHEVRRLVVSQMDKLKICIDALRVLARQSNDPNAQLLAERRINEYLRPEFDNLRTSLRQIAGAINTEAGKRVEEENWRLMGEYVQSCRDRLLDIFGVWYKD